MNDIEKIQEYVPTVYVNDSEPDLNETNLNKTEEALKRVTDAANKAIDALKQLEQEKLSLSAISSVLSDANDKVPSLALVNAMQKEIDETNSNLVMKINSGDITEIIGALPIGKYAGCYSSGASGTPSTYGTFEAIIMNDSAATITAINTGNGEHYINIKTNNVWKGWEKVILNTDLMIFGGAKSIAIATETNIVHMYFYTDGNKQNGYRIDVNGTTKRLSLLRITNGSSVEICGVGMS